jgi:hypothetical protein
MGEAPSIDLPSALSHVIVSEDLRGILEFGNEFLHPNAVAVVC